MHYKKPIITVSILLSFFSLKAQKCEVKSDPFSNEKVVEFSSKMYSLVHYIRKNDTTCLTLEFRYLGEHNIPLPEGTKLLMKLDNGDIVEIKSSELTNPESRIWRNNVYTAYKVKFLVSNETISNLSGQVIELFRIPTVDGKTLDIKPKGLTDVNGIDKYFAKMIVKGAECIESEL